jgi:hypothetical protein
VHHLIRAAMNHVDPSRKPRRRPGHPSHASHDKPRARRPNTFNIDAWRMRLNMSVTDLTFFPRASRALRHDRSSGAPKVRQPSTLIFPRISRVNVG